jgi:hypothetical protein
MIPPTIAAEGNSAQNLFEADIIAHAKKLAIAGPNSTGGFGPISCHLDALSYKIQIAR